MPDEAGRRAAERIVELTQGLTADDLVLCLISGGASSLLALPASVDGYGLTLDEKQRDQPRAAADRVRRSTR